VKDEKNIKTSNVSVYPWYDYTEKGTELLDTGQLCRFLLSPP